MSYIYDETFKPPLAPSNAFNVFGHESFGDSGHAGGDVTIITAEDNTKHPVYRIFFKGNDTPVDIMTQSVWSLCRHQGIAAGVGSESGYYQRAAKMTSLHFTGNKHPWNPLISPQNPVRGGSAAQISNSNSSLADNYLPLENIAAVFHRTILLGAKAIESGVGSPVPTFSPQIIKSNAYRVILKGGGTFDLKAGGYAITSQPTLRMIKPDGNFDTVEKIVRPTKPLVYFYGYGGQHYVGDQHDSVTQASDYPANTQSYNYNLRSGLAGPSVGHFTAGSSSYTGITIDGPVEGNYTTSVSDPLKGDPLSLDTGATYLPLENVLGITQLNSGDSGFSLTNPSDLNSSSLLEYQTYVRDAQNNPSPLSNMAQGDNGRGYTNVYQPADAGASTLITE